ncbi:hypothetical protein AAE478_002954 [Parahypoxylon ruwenzoriense]
MEAPTSGNFSHKATFGFELEFLVLFRELGVADPLKLERNGQQSRPAQQIPEEPHGLAKSDDGPHEVHIKRLYHFGGEIAKKLAEAGIPTSYRDKGHPKADEAPYLDRDPKLGNFGDFCFSSYKENTIVPEETMIWTDPAANGGRMAVRPETPNGYFWLGFEFVSKVYLYRDFDSAKSDLEITCRVLRANYLVSVNAGKDAENRSSRCATHVHWGMGGAEYDLGTIKRILTLMWVTEEKLMNLHATWRQNAGKYAALLQKGTNMARNNTSKLPGWVSDLDKGDWIREMDQNVPPVLQGSLHGNKPKIQWLWRAETVDDLARLVGEASKSRRASVAITELLPATSSFGGKVRQSQLNTVEFRHMQGSLDPALIAAWIDVTAGIIRQCVDLPPGEFSSFLADVASCVSDRNLTVQELLFKLGVARETCMIFGDFNQQRLDEEADQAISMFLPEL